MARQGAEHRSPPPHSTLGIRRRPGSGRDRGGLARSHRRWGRAAAARSGMAPRGCCSLCRPRAFLRCSDSGREGTEGRQREAPVAFTAGTRGNRLHSLPCVSLSHCPLGQGNIGPIVSRAFRRRVRGNRNSIFNFIKNE
jgi:hypothetical protein